MREREYWEKRSMDMILTSERSVLDYEKSLFDVYDYALAEIKKEIDAFFLRYSKENKIPYAEVRKRLTDAEKNPYQAMLKEWYRTAQELGFSTEFSKYLQDLGKKVYITRLEYLESSIRYQIEKAKNQQYNMTTNLLSDNYLAGYYTSYFDTAQGLEVSVRLGDIDSRMIEKTLQTRRDGANYSDRIWNDKDRLIQEINKILPRSFSQGLNSNKLGDAIAKELGVTKSRGRALMRTEVNYITNQGALDSYKSIGIEEYQYLATLDFRTSDICREEDGFIGKVSQAVVGVNYPPLHVNCRSTTIPYFPDENVEERIAKDENGRNIKVPRKMTQVEWIKKYVSEDKQAHLLTFLKNYQNSEEK